MPSQRQYFLSSFFNSFRQQQPPSIQASKHSTQPTSSATASSNTAASSSVSNAASQNNTSSPSASRSISTTAAAAAAAHSQNTRGMTIHSPRAAIPIPGSSDRRRGSDSSSEGFRDAIGADKWYIGGRTATGEEKFFKLGVVRRVRSNDGLSLDRLSL